MATASRDRKTPVFDWVTGDFLQDVNGKVVTATGRTAAEQVIIKAQQTTRGRFTIYRNTENGLLNHKYGNDAPITLTRPDITDAVRLAELKRDVKEAVIYDPWITDVVDVVAARQKGDEVYVSFTVNTIFDQGVTIEGVLASVWPTDI